MLNLQIIIKFFTLLPDLPSPLCLKLKHHLVSKDLQVFQRKSVTVQYPSVISGKKNCQAIIYPFITPILKSLVILFIWLSLIGAIYSRMAQFFFSKSHLFSGQLGSFTITNCLWTNKCWALVWCWNHASDFRPNCNLLSLIPFLNCTPHSSVTIIYHPFLFCFQASQIAFHFFLKNIFHWITNTFLQSLKLQI